MTCISVYTRTAVLVLAFGLGMLASALDERERLFHVTAARVCSVLCNGGLDVTMPPSTAQCKAILPNETACPSQIHKYWIKY